MVRQFEDETSLEKMIPVASGKLGNAGYYTVDFNQGIEVDAGERYAVVLYIITPGSYIRWQSSMLRMKRLKM